MTANKTQPIIQPQLAHTLFERALELLEAPNIAHNRPHSWQQGTLARGVDHCSCDPTSDLAVAYCELGAMQAVVYSIFPGDEDGLLQAAAANNYLVSLFNMANPNVIQADSVPAVNDAHDTTFDLVRRMFQRAINLTDKLISKQTQGVH